MCDLYDGRDGAVTHPLVQDEVGVELVVCTGEHSLS